MKLIIYDKFTGEITGRITCSTAQAKLYPVEITPEIERAPLRFREITSAEYDERPELFQKIDVAADAAPLIALSEKEALDKGASREFIDEKIGAGKMTPDKRK